MPRPTRSHRRHRRIADAPGRRHAAALARTTRCASSSPPSPSHRGRDRRAPARRRPTAAASASCAAAPPRPSRSASLVPILVQAAARSRPSAPSCWPRCGPASASRVGPARRRRLRHHAPRAGAAPGSTFSTGSCSTASSSRRWPSSPAPAGGGPARSRHGEGAAPECRVAARRVLDRACSPTCFWHTPAGHRHGDATSAAWPRSTAPSPARRPPASCGRGRCASTGRRGCRTAPAHYLDWYLVESFAALGAAQRRRRHRDPPRPARRRRRPRPHRHGRARRPVGRRRPASPTRRRRLGAPRQARRRSPTTSSAGLAGPPPPAPGIGVLDAPDDARARGPSSSSCRRPGPAAAAAVARHASCDAASLVASPARPGGEPGGPPATGAGRRPAAARAARGS